MFGRLSCPSSLKQDHRLAGKMIDEQIQIAAPQLPRFTYM